MQACKTSLCPRDPLNEKDLINDLQYNEAPAEQLKK